tara:strand:- start:4174 stop:7098 length:2925 start_codon:yes stop_codon:yes gene_type:complete
MKKTFTLLVLATLLFQFSCKEKEEQSKPAYKYEYESVENDGLNTLIYTLDNGLKVYMSINKDEPRIQTNIAVKTGSKQDPADATGLAHYLEHMLFKGTSKIATVNWEEEKKVLQQISDLYEKRRNTTDETERNAIYKQIDSLSGVAAKFAVPNEYDKMISSLGAKGTNAYTSTERTVYINDIPSNEFEKWLTVESERFKELVLRLFHTELETVYEEYNRSRDNDYWLAYEAMSANLFKNHPYGTQTTIGTGEHLKNPSMVKIHEYFNERYVPNNMAIILAGDIDPDKTVDLIKKHFGEYKNKEVPEFTFTPEEEITEPIETTIVGPDAEWVSIGYRLPGVKNEDTYILPLVSSLLYNYQAGLIDLNLVKDQKVLSANAYDDVSYDYSTFQLSANPRDGQTLEEARDLLLSQIEKLKTGDFEDWMLPAAIKNFKLQDQQRNLYNNYRAYKMTNAFILEQNWADVVKENDKMSKVTKQQIVDFANKYFKNNYVVVYKKHGETNNPKVEKPEITKVDLNRDTASVFAQEFEKMDATRLEPIFDDYSKINQSEKINGKIPFYFMKNTKNKIFSLNYILDMGSYSDKEIALAVQYLEYLGTDKYSANELQVELFKKGLSYSVYATDERVYVSLSGLEESFEDGVELFEHILANVQPNQEAYDNMVQGIYKERQDNKLSKYYILYRGMFNYGRYGEESPMKHIFSNEELKKIDVNNLVAKIKELTSYEHYVYYYGKKELAEAKTILEKHHKTPETLKPLIAAKEFPELDINKNQVFFVDYDMVQTEMLLFTKQKPYTEGDLPMINLFNEYFGSGLSSIVFQEIREAKALAYSAYSFVTTPSKPDRSHYVQAYIGTQVDKQKEATKAMLELMNNMPEVNDQYEGAKLAALKKIETSRTKESSLFWKFLSAKELGRDYDINTKVYPAIKEMQLSDLKTYFDNNIKGKNYAFLVIGNKKLVDKKALSEQGEYKKLTLEEIFGY